MQRKLAFQRIPVATLWVALIVLIVTGEPFRCLAQRRAVRTFRDSRRAAPGTYEFITRGVEVGMSEAEVDELLLPADEVRRHMPQKQPPWKGFITIYEHRYGTWHHPVLPIERNLGVENVWVYFDDNGHAQRMYWRVSGAIAGNHRAFRLAEVDLSTRTIE